MGIKMRERIFSEYDEFSIDVLESAIKRSKGEIRKIEATVKRYNRNLTLHNGRGYSNEKKRYFESYIKHAPSLIASREEEIAECQASIDKRPTGGEVA